MKSVKKISALILALVLLCSVFYGCAKKEDTSQLSEEAKERGEYVSFIETKNDADCALIHIKDHNILIDTGEKKDAESILNFLEEKGVNDIEMLIITHFDKDHCGGGAEIINSLHVKEVIHPEYIEEKDASETFISAVRNKGVTETVINQITELRFDTVSLCFYPAIFEYEDDTSNNSSLIVKLTYFDKSVLFTGDIEDERISDVLGSGAEYLDCDVLKVPYHGREIENEQDLINAVSPRYSVVTGSGKRVKKNIESLGDSLGEVYYSQDGTVTFYFNYKTDFEITVYK